MRIHKVWALIGTTIAALALLPLRVIAASPLDGTWVGSLAVGSNSLRLVLNISSDGEVLRATMDSLDQGVRGIPVDVITIKDADVQFSLNRIGGEFNGKLETGPRIVGSWSQNGMSLPLTWTPGERPVTKRPQEPVKPYPYIEEEVSYENAAAKIKLAGTLTKPQGKGPFPAVLLITGSGPQNRNEELMGHKPFLVLADYLTRRGIAVLRVDDRGVGQSTGAFGDATWHDFVQDALASVAYLKSRKDIDLKRIGLIGHSEGGLIAPAAAVQSKDVVFIVMLAGPGAGGADVLVRQMDQMALNGGASLEVRQMVRDFNTRILAIATTARDDATALAEMEAALEDQLQVVNDSQSLSPNQKNLLFTMVSPAAARTQFRNLLRPWMRAFLSFDPLPALRQVKCPVLAINGELDQQVFVDQNVPFIEAALKEGGNKDFTVQVLPGLNHMFQAAKTGATSEYASIEETINPAALAVVGDWVIKQTKSR
jgi:pimeloyl-ACP methyl ester carboxylesterase